MKKRLVIIALVLGTGLLSCKKKGCMDPAATNYSQEAEKDDGSCQYPEVIVIEDDIAAPTTIAGNTKVEICGDISVSSNLTIEPGVTLEMCAGASITIEETGYISAVGTAANPIVFRGATETKGFWEGLAIKSNNPNNKLHYVTIKDAGTYWGWEYANIYVKDGAKLELNHSEVSNSENIGLFVSESASLPNFGNNTFSNNTTGLDVHVKSVKDLDAASNYNNGNTNDFINVRSGTLTSDVNWVATSTPYLINGFYTDAGLTIAAGATLLMEADSYIQVNSTGYLKAIGTSSNKIEIKGRYTSAAFWDGIKFGSNNPNNELTYVIVKDGGKYWGYDYANILLDGSLKLDNSEISNANSWGMNITSSSTLTSGGAAQSTATGVEANNTFSSNGAGPDANCTGGCGVNFE